MEGAVPTDEEEFGGRRARGSVSTRIDGVDCDPGKAFSCRELKPPEKVAPIVIREFNSVMSMSSSSDCEK